MTPISINNPNVTQVVTGKPMKMESFSNENLLVDLSAIPTARERQAQADYQNSVPQTTVIEKNGEVLAVFGDNGWGKSFSNSDYFGENLSEDQFIEAFKDKYGSSITINQYSKESAPTMSEINEQKYGRILTPKVDYYV